MHVPMSSTTASSSLTGSAFNDSNKEYPLWSQLVVMVTVGSVMPVFNYMLLCLSIMTTWARAIYCTRYVMRMRATGDALLLH